MKLKLVLPFPLLQYRRLLSRNRVDPQPAVPEPTKADARKVV
jgi:hypothetical protein